MRISKRRINDKLLLKIYRLFFEVVSRFNSKDTFFEIIDDILYPTEKIMVAKRVAIIYLLTKEIPQNTIAETLKVSTGTVSRFAIIFHSKETKVVRLLTSMIKKENVLNFLEDLWADLSIQPGIKIGHWQSYWDHQRKKEKREEVGI